MLCQKLGFFDFHLAMLASFVLLFGASWAGSGRQLLVGFWGQNMATSANGPENNEKPLKDVCQTTKYDILLVSFLDKFWRKPGELPSLDLAYHCDEPYSKEYPGLLQCPKIQEGIDECHKLGKKVLLSVGGPTGDGTLQNPDKAKEFASTLFDLFLGGSGYEDMRPFGEAVMDGINLDIEGGGKENYPELIRELRALMNSDTTRKYLIAASPHCPYPDRFIGPGPGTGLEEAGGMVDHVYVKFYNNFCYVEENHFMETLDDWLGFARRIHGPLIFVGVPAHPSASLDPKFYQPPYKLAKIYSKVENKPDLGGIMIWDVSWDQVNLIDGTRFSTHVYNILKDTTIVESTPEATTQKATQGVPSTNAPSQEAFTCVGKPDGYYANPSECSKYYLCSGGTKYDKHCAPDLVFNPTINACDWPINAGQC